MPSDAARPDLFREPKTADYEAVEYRIKKARARGAKSLSLSNYRALEEIPDLSGLETLEYLLIFGSSVKSLTPLSKLKNLKRLYVVSSQVTDITGLSELKALNQLYLWGNPDLTEISSISELTRLTTLVLQGTSVSDLTAIRNLKNVSVLRLSGTRVSDLSPISGLTRISNLELSGTLINDVSVIGRLTNLNRLNIAGTRISNIDALSNCQFINTLILSNTAITDITPISGMTFLRNLYLTKTNVSDLSAISGLTELQCIDIEHTPVDSLKAIRHFDHLQELNIGNSKISDLTPLAYMEPIYRYAEAHDFRGVSFDKLPLTDPNLQAFSLIKDKRRTTRTIDYLREQLGLQPLAGGDTPDDEDYLEPIDRITSPYSFSLSEAGTISARPGPVTVPTFPLVSSERDFGNRLDVCRALSRDLISDLQSGKYQARSDYLDCLEKYEERLPSALDRGNILLADAEARTIRNLFASEADIISVPFASKLKTLLEQHIGLRVFFPELSSFYRDVQQGRIDTPLPLDAVDGFIRTVREATPTIFDSSVEDAVEGSTSEGDATVIATARAIERSQEAPLLPPRDPLGEVDPERAANFTFAGTVNGLWKAFTEGERVYRSLEAWKHTGAALRPYVSEILRWLHHFNAPGPS